MLVLHLVKGVWNFSQDQIEISETKNIGRGPENDIILRDPYVSNKQCQIVRMPDGWKIIDMKSRNGTKIQRANGEWAMATSNIWRPLRNKDKITIGETVLEAFLDS